MVPTYLEIQFLMDARPLISPSISPNAHNKCETYKHFYDLLVQDFFGIFNISLQGMVTCNIVYKFVCNAPLSPNPIFNIWVTNFVEFVVVITQNYM